MNQVGKVYSLRLTISSLGFSTGLLIAAPLFQTGRISLVQAGARSCARSSSQRAAFVSPFEGLGKGAIEVSNKVKQTLA